MKLMDEYGEASNGPVYGRRGLDRGGVKGTINLPDFLTKNAASRRREGTSMPA